MKFLFFQSPAEFAEDDYSFALCASVLSVSPAHSCFSDHFSPQGLTYFNGTWLVSLAKGYSDENKAVDTEAQTRDLPVTSPTP